MTRVLLFVPLILIALNKISIDHNYDKWGDWHGNIQKAIGVDWVDTPEYGLDMFIWLGMIRLMAVVGFVYAGLRLKVKGFEKDLIWINVFILTWFFLEFILIYNMASSIPKVITGVCLIVISLIVRK